MEIIICSQRLNKPKLWQIISMHVKKIELYCYALTLLDTNFVCVQVAHIPHWDHILYSVFFLFYLILYNFMTVTSNLTHTHSHRNIYKQTHDSIVTSHLELNSFNKNENKNKHGGKRKRNRNSCRNTQKITTQHNHDTEIESETKYDVVHIKILYSARARVCVYSFRCTKNCNLNRCLMVFSVSFSRIIWFGNRKTYVHTCMEQQHAQRIRYSIE